MTGVELTGGALLAIVFLLGAVAGMVVCSMAGWLGRRDAQPPVAPAPVAPVVRARAVQDALNQARQTTAAPADPDAFGFEPWHEACVRPAGLVVRGARFEQRMRRATDGIGRGTRRPGDAA